MKLEDRIKSYANTYRKRGRGPDGLTSKQRRRLSKKENVAFISEARDGR